MGVLEQMDFVSGNMIFNIYYCLFVESVVDGKGGKSIRLGVGLAKINSKNPNNRLFWDLLNAFFPKKKKKKTSAMPGNASHDHR